MNCFDVINDNLINCYRTQNYRFDFSSDLLYVDDFAKGVFINIKPLHKEEFIEYFENKPILFDRVLPLQQDKFYESYIEFMNNYCSKKRNIRYATQLTIMYPKKLQLAIEKKRFIKTFVMQVSGVNDMLPYYVENYVKGNGNFARITIIDRLYLGKKVWKIYKKDVWIDSRNNKFPNKDCPEEFKILKCKAGEFVLDKDGKRIPSDAVFSNSLRIFSYTKDMETGRNKWNEYISTLKQKFVVAVLKVCGQTNTVKKGKRLSKINCKPEYHQYVRRRISAMNFARQTIEYTINYLLKIACEKDIEYISYKEGKNNVVHHSEQYKKITNIFYKYKERFKKGEYHDENGRLHQLNYFNLNVYELDNSIKCLLDLFFKDIAMIEI